MGDLGVSGALSSLFGIVVILHDGIGSHRVGKADIRFQLTRYSSYLRDDESDLIDRGKASRLSRATAVRLLDMHAGLVEVRLPYYCGGGRPSLS